MASAVIDAMRETFEPVNSGASLSYPSQCSALRVGGFVNINGEPCKIVQIGISKTGKHGGSKMHVVAIHLFTNKKMETLLMSTDNCDVPYVERKEYQLIHIDNDGFLSLYDEGIPKQDICIGETGVDAELREVFKSGKDLLVTIQSAMGKEAVFSFKEERAV